MDYKNKRNYSTILIYITNIKIIIQIITFRYDINLK
jgi:hypothetical protein